MSRFDEILNKIDEANYRDDEREFDRDSCEKIIKDAEILATAAKELKIRLKQDDYKACASILKKMAKDADRFEANVRGTALNPYYSV